MKKTLAKIDKPLLIITIILCGIGLLMVFSASSITAMQRYDKSSTYFFVRQIIFLIIGFGGGFLLLFIKTKHYEKLSLLLTVLIIIALSSLLIYGEITNHTQSWFYIPKTGFAIQPAEFAKSILIIFMACYYCRIVKIKSGNFLLYLIPLGIAMIMGILILMQPDFGSAFILLGIAFGIFISLPLTKSKLPKIVLIIGLLAIIIVGILLYSGVDILNSDQMSRFNFRNPCQRYTDESGYQVCNGFIAINNGGITGRGIGNSTQKYSYLPESHTDFIYAIWVEELGLIAGIIVILLYILLLYRLLKIAKEAYNLRNSIIAYGTFWLFTFHIVINLGGMLALMPLTGVPLPLMSYGGSSTINFLVMLFLSQRVAVENKETKNQLELKKLTS